MSLLVLLQDNSANYVFEKGPHIFEHSSSFRLCFGHFLYRSCWVHIIDNNTFLTVEVMNRVYYCSPKLLNGPEMSACLKAPRFLTSERYNIISAPKHRLYIFHHSSWFRRTYGYFIYRHADPLSFFELIESMKPWYQKTNLHQIIIVICLFYIAGYYW